MKWTIKLSVATASATCMFVILFAQSQQHVDDFPRRKLVMFDPTSLRAKKPTRSGLSLEFVHNPRTGGTAVVTAAWQQQQIAWGVCHFETVREIGCGSRPDWPQKLLDQRGPERRYAGEAWFAPPKWLHPNPYAAHDTFTIVRNPYDRVVSEYHATTELSIYRNAASNRDPRAMNEWTQLKLKEVFQLKSYPGHFLPQTYYVYDTSHRQTITHVLRYEQLQPDFRKLMKDYNLDITLPIKPAEENTLTKEFLSPETIALINQVYGADFVNFGYDMVQRPSQFAQPSTSASKTAIVKTWVMNKEADDADDAFEMAEQQAAMSGMQQ